MDQEKFVKGELSCGRHIYFADDSTVFSVLGFFSIICLKFHICFNLLF